MNKQRKVIDVDLYDDKGKNESNSNNIDFNNIDFGQITDLLKNVDINQLSSMMGGLGDLNSIIGGSDGLLGNIFGGSAAPPEPAEEKVREADYPLPYPGDKRIAILSALKPMVSPERAGLIDMVIQIYIISKILRG